MKYTYLPTPKYTEFSLSLSSLKTIDFFFKVCVSDSSLKIISVLTRTKSSWPSITKLVVDKHLYKGISIAVLAKLNILFVLFWVFFLEHWNDSLHINASTSLLVLATWDFLICYPSVLLPQVTQERTQNPQMSRKKFARHFPGVRLQQTLNTAIKNHIFPESIYFSYPK